MASETDGSLAERLPPEVLFAVFDRMDSPKRTMVAACARTCLGWTGVAQSFLWKHVVLRSQWSLEAFLADSPTRLDASIRTITLHLDNLDALVDAFNEDEADRFNGVSQPMSHGRLLRLMQVFTTRLRGMSQLQSLSILDKPPHFVPFRSKLSNGRYSGWLPYTLLASVLLHLPPTCTHLDLDLPLCHADMHLCPVLSQRSRQLQCVRVRLPFLCPLAFSGEETQHLRQCIVNTAILPPLLSVDFSRYCRSAGDQGPSQRIRYGDEDGVAWKPLAEHAREKIPQTLAREGIDFRIISVKTGAYDRGTTDIFVRHELAARRSVSLPVAMLGGGIWLIRVPTEERGYVVPYTSIHSIAEGPNGWLESVEGIRLPAHVFQQNKLDVGSAPMTEAKWREGRNDKWTIWEMERLQGRPVLVPCTGDFMEQLNMMS